jgi:hypothetical protein
MLRKAAERIRSLERDGVKSVSESVSAVLEQAVKSGEELVSAAAERDVHDRLSAAMTDMQASVSRVGVSQAEELALTVEDPSDDVTWADASADEVADQRKSA